MGKINQTLAIVITLIIVLSCLTLLIAKPTSAQAIAKPSVPNFNVKLVPNSYTVTTTDPYTGKITTEQIDNTTIQISITNQQYTYSNGSTFYLYYNIQTKGHFSENWTELYPTYPAWANAQAYNSPNYKNDQVPYIALIAEDPKNSIFGLPQTQTTHTTISIPKPEPSGQVDFQVKAMIGKNSTYYDPTNNIVYDPSSGGVDRPAVAYVTSSDWSNTITVNLDNGSISNSASPNSSPTFPEFSWLVIVPLLLTVFAVAVVLRHRKNRSQIK